MWILNHKSVSLSLSIDVFATHTHTSIAQSIVPICCPVFFWKARTEIQFSQSIWKRKPHFTLSNGNQWKQKETIRYTTKSNTTQWHTQKYTSTVSKLFNFLETSSFSILKSKKQSLHFFYCGRLCFFLCFFCFVSSTTHKHP